MNDHVVRKSIRVLAVLVLCAAALVATLGSVRAKSATGTTGAELAVANQQGAALSNVFIVQLDGEPLAVYNGGIEGLEATNPAAHGQIKLDVQAPASVAYLAYLADVQSGVLASIEGALGRPVEVVFQYQVVYNGFAIRLNSDAEANAVAGVPGVVMVQRETMETLDTDVGPAFIGATALWDGTGVPGGIGTKGEGIVAGVLDTGINFDSPSFAAVGPVDGYIHTNPYPGYLGWCAANPGNCNNKLVGAYTFVTEPQTPDDSDGHGSHTASTVAGNEVDATISAGGGFSATRRVRGVAPHANIIAYDVCIETCPGSALLAAANQAATDQVDVINYSISGGNSPWTDPVEIAFRNAQAVGVFVSTSAGNAGTVSSVAHRSPWVATTAASTHNRKWVNAVDSLGGTGPTPPGQPIVGAGFAGGTAVLPIVYAGSTTPTNPLCLAGVWAPGTFTNQIVICDRGTNGRVEKGEVVLAAGGDGMILVNDAPNGNSLSADVHALPAVHIGFDIGTALKAWVAATTNPVGRIVGGTESLDMANGDIMASFSSLGPSTNVDIIKPDITAPGVDIWAAYAGPSTSYNFVSGTSMSSPHNAGAAALMSDVFPTWSSSALKSAMMMTADQSVTKRDGVTPADPFDYGAGRVDLTRAARVGFILDETTANYIAANPGAGGDPRTLNLPSMQNSAGGGTSAWNFATVTFTPNAGPVAQHMPLAWRTDSCDTESCSWTRTLTNVWPTAVAYTASRSDSRVMITPSSFTLTPGGTQTVVITIGAPTAVTLGTLESGNSTTLPLAIALGTALVAMAGLVALRRNRA